MYLNDDETKRTKTCGQQTQNYNFRENGQMYKNSKTYYFWFYNKKKSDQLSSKWT